MKIPGFEEIIEQNDQTAARREHLDALRGLVGNVYPNKFERSVITGREDTITNILNYSPIAEVLTEIGDVVSRLAERTRPPAEIKDALNARLKELGNVRISGRLAVPPRVMGKAAFVHLSDGISRLQIYVRKDEAVGVYNGDSALGAEGGEVIHDWLRGDDEDTSPASTVTVPAEELRGWDIFQLLDHGDFVGVEGFLFITNTGELSVHVAQLQFLAKAMLPMPDKMHGIADAEIKQRQRYVDLIGSSLQVEHEGLTTREVFETRAKVISSLRHFLENHGYIEVETPMLTPKATGAVARPFKTHHNALDIDLYARIAPELYLKRLVVGGFEKVYELNRNFRNEGISFKHNPEFTMLEFYCAYMDVDGMMDFCEELVRHSVLKATGGLTVNYERKEINFNSFDRLTMKAAIAKYWERDWSYTSRGEFEVGMLDDIENLRYFAALLQTFPKVEHYSFFPNALVGNIAGKQDEAVNLYAENPKLAEELTKNYTETESTKYNDDETEAGSIIARLFEFFAEPKLRNPTFIVDFPKSISPLSKASPENPNIAERFELFINGMEIANGFSELNDPKEQYERFVDQTNERERGDEEAMILDEDYIRAISYGMPPAAGIGIGIDRLVMLLTNRHSIRDVILFPHMRPERKSTDEESTELPTE